MQERTTGSYRGVTSSAPDPPLHDGLVRLLRPCQDAPRHRGLAYHEVTLDDDPPSGRPSSTSGSMDRASRHDRRAAHRRVPGASRSRPLRAPGRATPRAPGTAQSARLVQPRKNTSWSHRLTRTALGLPARAGSAGRTSSPRPPTRSCSIGVPQRSHGSPAPAVDAELVLHRSVRAVRKRGSRGASSPAARSPRAGARRIARWSRLNSSRSRLPATRSGCSLRARAPRRHRCSRARRASAGRGAPTSAAPGVLEPPAEPCRRKRPSGSGPSLAARYGRRRPVRAAPTCRSAVRRGRRHPSRCPD